MWSYELVGLSPTGGKMTEKNKPTKNEKAISQKKEMHIS